MSINDKLRQMVETVEIFTTLTAPVLRSLENFLAQSAVTLKCTDASIIVRDPKNEQNLKFLAATGKVADKLLTLKIPIEKGIAGFVYSSGQPMVIADVAHETAFYSEVDRQTGFTTQMILATPIKFDDEVIGVLEFINRDGEQPFEPFTPDEMDKAALYAEAVGLLVHSYESADLVEQLCTLMSRDILYPNTATEWLNEIRAGEEHQEMLEIARLVQRIATKGTSERNLAKQILTSIDAYTEDNSPVAGFLSS